MAQGVTVRASVRGEGVNDYGRLAPYNRKVEEEGCYICFVRTALPEAELTCVNAGRFPRKLPGGKTKKQLRGLKGFARHAFLATLEAYESGADCLIIGTDTDRGLTRKKPKLPEACLKRYEEFRSGYEKAIEFRPEAADVRLVVLVPLVKLESWLLADEAGFETATGFARGKLPKKPEELYGQTDAKDVLNGLFEEQGQPPPGTPEKARLAAEASPKTLEKQCPVSYPPFLNGVDRLRKLLVA